MKTPEEIYKLWSNEDCENGRHETRYNSLGMVEFAKFYHSVMKVEERKEKEQAAKMFNESIINKLIENEKNNPTCG